MHISHMTLNCSVFEKIVPLLEPGPLLKGHPLTMRVGIMMSYNPVLLCVFRGTVKGTFAIIRKWPTNGSDRTVAAQENAEENLR